jgi:hypothetical protein
MENTQKRQVLWSQKSHFLEYKTANMVGYSSF